MIIEEARATAPDPGETSASVTVIAVDETLSAAADVASVVESASGTVVRRLGGLGDYAAVSIRGSSFRQVQIYLDGIPLNPDGSDTVNLSELPLSAFERVEIYRGNAPASFAAAPIGGVVNLVTGEQEASSGALAYGDLDTARLSATAAQRGEILGLDSEAMVLAEVFSTAGDFEYFTDNSTIYNVFDDARLERVNNDKDQLSAITRLRIGPDHLRLTVSDSFLARREGLPGHAAILVEDASLETTRNIATVGLEGSGGLVRWQGRAWQQLRLETYDDRQGEVGTGVQWEDSRTETIGVLGHGVVVVAPWLLPALTLTTRRDSYAVTDRLLEEAEEPRQRTALGATLSADSWFFAERLKVSPMVQLTWLNNRLLGTVPFSEVPVAPAGEDTLLAVNPRGGVLVRPLEGIALKANAGTYLRPPDFTELFGDRGGIIGNTDLVPEEGWQWDAGVRLTAPDSRWLRGALDAAWFASHTDNQIIFIQNSQRTSVPVNLGRARTDGIELSVVVDVLGVLDSQSNLTWTRSENRTPYDNTYGNQLPRVPEWEAYQGTSLHWEERLRLGHTFSYTAGNYWDATNYFLAAPRALHGVFVRAGSGRLSAEGSILNLTDATVVAMDRNPVSEADDTPIIQPLTDFIGYPLPGRTWLFTLRWSGMSPDTGETP